jgi:hypothetical protein
VTIWCVCQGINRKLAAARKHPSVRCVALRAEGVCRVMLRGVDTQAPQVSGGASADGPAAAAGESLPTVLLEEYDAGSVREGDKVRGCATPAAAAQTTLMPIPICSRLVNRSDSGLTAW